MDDEPIIYTIENSVQSPESNQNGRIMDLAATRAAAAFFLLLISSSFLPGCTGLSSQALQGEPAQRFRVEAQSFEIECRKCHPEIVNTYLQTAHYRTSSEASPETVLGSFSEGRNRLHTADPSTRFLMTRDGEQLYQTAVWLENGRQMQRRELIDFVIGSGRKGQTYLYWKDGFLFQLPVSYLVEGDQWINSPGFEDGKVNFGRGIPPRCLECHASHFLLEFEERRPRYRDDYVTGIGCNRCHGRAERHAAYHRERPEEVKGRYIVNPARLSRERQLDSCSVCHSGDREVKKSTFAFTPGDDLSEFLSPDNDSQPYPDVHGNQVALLSQSACFKESSEMTCNICHDVHRTERDLEGMSEKCLSCHTEDHPPLDTTSVGRLQENCIDCHMPLRESRILTIHLRDRIHAPRYRDHRIAVYRGENQ